MKKKFILSVVSLMSIFSMAACKTNTSSSSASDSASSSTGSSTTASTASPSSTSSSSTPISLSTLSIANKADLTSFFYKGDSNRSLNITTDADKNVDQLISNGDITITSSNSSAISVLGIYLAPVGVGEATITVSGGGKSDSVTLYVGNPTTLVPEDTEVGVGKTLSISIDSELNSKTLTDYNWTSSDTSIATVADGVVTGVKVGTVTITGVLKSNAKEGASISVDVKESVSEPVAINTITKAGTYTVRGKVAAINTNSYILDDGQGSIMVYKTCTFSLGDVVKVTGKVTTYSNQLEFSSNLVETKVGAKVTSMTAVELTKDILDGAKAASAAAYHTYGKLYKWNATAELTSSGYLTLNLNGCEDLVEPLKMDSKTFPYKEGHYYSVEGYWCIWNNSNRYHGFVITKLVEISPETTIVFISDAKMQVDAKNTRQLSATYLLSEADKNVNAVTWSSSDTSIATVDQNGVVTGVAKGECEIIATVGGGSAKCKLTVIDEVALSNINTLTEEKSIARVRGVILDVSSKGYLINDGTGSIFVYMLNRSSLLYKKGDYIEVTSKLTNYNGILMFENVTKDSSNKNQYGVLDNEIYQLDAKDKPSTTSFETATALTSEIAASLKTTTTLATTVSGTKKYSFTAKVSGKNLVVDGMDDVQFYDDYTSSTMLSTLKDSYKYKIEGYYIGTDSKYSSLNIIVTKATLVAETRVDPEKSEVTTSLEESVDVAYTWSVADTDNGTISATSLDTSIATVKLNAGKKTVTITPVKTGTVQIKLAINGTTKTDTEVKELASNTIDVTITSHTTVKMTGVDLGIGASYNATEKTTTFQGTTYAYTAMAYSSDHGTMTLASAAKSGSVASTFRNTTAYDSGIVSFTVKMQSNTYSNANILKIEFGDDENCDKESFLMSTEKNKIEYVFTPTVSTYKYFKVSYNLTNYTLFVESFSVVLD